VQQLTPAEFAFALAVAIGAAIVVFAHADKRGNKHATAWGILSFFIPAAALVYFGRHWWGTRRRR
jgi:peptidoglycan/LPS O-acetylase OafA/YrhL